MALRKKSPYLKIFEQAVAKMVESGQLGLLQERFSAGVTQCPDGPAAKALSLEKIITLFIGLVVGTVALPFLVLISEFFFIFQKKKKEKKIQAVSSDRGSNPIVEQCTVMHFVHF